MENFTTSITTGASPSEVFDAITNVSAWWSEEIQGEAAKPGDEFFYHYKDVHSTRIRIIEVIPDRKIVWQVVTNEFSFTTDKTEWTGNRMVFDIATNGDTTVLTFTQIGLTPEYECYAICREAWTNYITHSLHDLIVHGKGQPNPKEGGFNEQMVEKIRMQQ